MADKKTRAEIEIERRRDTAIKKALSTPPKLHRDMKKGAQKKRQSDRPTASEKST